jgi:LPS O-antigen subunit length determinant protein (WzzB/FepE family)
MGPEILIPISLFLAIFGVIYLFLSTRNKERLALIEKGADASIFMKGRLNGIPAGRIIILNLALLLIGIGVGVFIALLLSTYTSLHNDAIYPATIFTTAGIGLFIGFNMTGKLEKVQN